jgi:hypothetical protein
MFYRENLAVATPPTNYFSKRNNNDYSSDIILLNPSEGTALYISYNTATPYNTSNDLSADVVEKAIYNRALKKRDLKTPLNALINSYSELKKGWDGYKANPVDMLCINNAIKIIDGLPNYILTRIDTSCIFPTPNGTLMFEIGSEDRYFIIDVGNTSALYYYRFDDILEGIDAPIPFTAETPSAITELFTEFLKFSKE